MFRPVAMMRLNLIVLEHDLRRVLVELAKSEAVQLVQTRAGPDTAPLAPRAHAEAIARCVQIVSRVDTLRRSLGFVPSETPQKAFVDTLEQAERKLSAMEERAGNFLKRRQALLEQWAKVTAEDEMVSSYKDLDLPLGAPDRYSFLHFVTGTLPAENLERLQSEVAADVALLPMPGPQGQQRLLAMTSRRGRVALEVALQNAGFQLEILPGSEGVTTDSLFEVNQRDREKLTLALEQSAAELSTLADEYSRPLVEVERLANFERSLFEAEQNFARTEAAVWITGWVPASEATELEARVSQVTAGRYAIRAGTADLLPEDQTPVLLRHRRLLRPFEMLVTAYGLPAYKELEPTIFVAFSYLLMFGMMFGDAGHGAILALAGLLALLAGRKEKTRDVGLLLLFGGFCSMLFGFIYGSCFGLPVFKQHALWRDPLEGNPLVLMYCAIGLGIVMISLGLVLNIVNRFKRGDVIGGLLDKFGLAGVLFYWGTLAFLANFGVIRSRGWVNLAIILFLVVPLLGWAIKEPLEYLLRHRAGRTAEAGGSLFTAFTESLVGAFEAVLSYLANTISFVRLAAYAMSHAALLVAAFMLAASVKHFPVGGDLLSVLVIVMGNLVAIVLEGVIASVQALRLEYYEFFGKFFSGNGRPFEPFRLGNLSRTIQATI